MDTLLLALRVVLSLGAVVGVLWLVQRRVTRTSRTRGTADPLTVVARRGLGQKASVVVVDTGGQRFVLGVTEHNVNVLHTSEAPAGDNLPEAIREVSRLRLVSPAARPEYAVQPEDTAQPRDTGQPEDTGQPRDTGQPENPAQTGAEAFAHMLEAARGNPEAMRRTLLHGVPPTGMSPAGRRSAAGDGGLAAAPQRFRERNRSSALDGSILAPSTWKQAAAVIRKGIIG